MGRDEKEKSLTWDAEDPSWRRGEGNQGPKVVLGGGGDTSGCSRAQLAAGEDSPVLSLERNKKPVPTRKLCKK